MIIIIMVIGHWLRYYWSLENITTVIGKHYNGHWKTLNILELYISILYKFYFEI